MSRASKKTTDESTDRAAASREAVQRLDRMPELGEAIEVAPGIRVRRVKIADLKQDPRNANRGTERGDWMLGESISKYGLGRGILLDADGRIIGGNKTQAKAGELGFDEALIVETDGNTLVATQRVDIRPDSAEAIELGLMDNRVGQTNLSWDPSVLGSMMEEGFDLDQMFSTSELDAILNPGEDGERHQEDGDPMEGGAAEKASKEPLGGLSKSDVPDAVWASDNDWGIPLLDSSMQADAADLPVVIWGSVSRNTRMHGTWLFYTEDYRYAKMWEDPTPVINSGCVNAVEPNYSIYSQMPRAVGIERIYKKRWIARYWQSQGIRVFVDLNVAEHAYDLNMLGVPKGWRAYATRGYSDRLHLTDREFEMAAERAGTKSLLFVVYGGGRKVKAYCQDRGFIWIPEHMDVQKGKFSVNASPNGRTVVPEGVKVDDSTGEVWEEED